MKRRAPAYVAFAAMLTGMPGCSEWTVFSAHDANAVPKQMVGHQILVTLPETLKAQWPAIAKALEQRYAMQASGEFPLPSIGVDCLVYKVPPQQSLQQVIKQLRHDSRVVLAQENLVFEGIQSSSNDPFAEVSYGPRLTHADAAHHVATGKGIKVAVVDTGAEKNHPDLRERISKTANFVEGGDLDFSRDRHGTAVAGVIGARANNGIGISGTAPDAEISVYKACWYPRPDSAKARCSSWSLAKALDAAIANGVRVINLSLAGPDDELLTKLITTAYARGINIVAAALEQRVQPGFPAQLPQSIAVISADADGQPVHPAWLPEFPATVAAPGVEILTTVPKSEYDFLSGSSLAAAHVSGIIALLLELQPELSPQQVKQLLLRADAPKAAPAVVDACALIKSLRPGLNC